MTEPKHPNRKKVILEIKSKSKSKVLFVRVTEDEWRKVDDYAKKRKVTRSDVTRAILDKFISKI